LTRCQVVDATPSQDAELAVSLARAFADDPLMTWLIPAADRREPATTRFFRQELSHARRSGLVLTTTDGGAAALWLPPRRWKMTPGEMVRAAPASLSAFGPRGVVRALRVLGAMEAVHPAEPHWYLSVIGSEPAHRGTGAGGALVRAVTDRCDAEGLPAYLESSKESNLGFYRRFGFEVSGEIPTPGGGPMQWSMWREPVY
jgi:ribosomal protein S18 acetylase RimI-like enzyme